MVIEVRDEHPENDAPPSEVTESGSWIAVRAEQPRKLLSPIDWIEFGRRTDERAEQSAKISPPMEVIEFGRLQVCKDDSSKTPWPRFVIEGGKLIDNILDL